MTRRRLSVVLAVLVLLVGTPWADAAAQITAAEDAVTRRRAEQRDEAISEAPRFSWCAVDQVSRPVPHGGYVSPCPRS
jgi:hypothetical protein